MTEQAFLALPPREQDALVAEKVMGLPEWQCYRKSYDASGDPFRDGPNYGAVPAYTTDIAAAWAVVEKMRERPTKRYGATLVIRVEEHPTTCAVTLFHPFAGSPADGGTLEYFEACAPIASLAICVAALRAVGALE